MDRNLPSEETLDPRDWDALRSLAHRMVDEMLEYHRTLDEQPVWQPLPAETKAALATDFPAEGIGEAAAYARFSEWIRPYAFGNHHPRGWGWVNGTGSSYFSLAEMWATAMNPNVWGGDHAAPYVEAQVIRWAKQLLGMPEEATGVLVTGGSVANLVGLAAARESACEGVSQRGLHASSGQLVIYASEEAHNSIDKAVSLLGIGWDSLRSIPTDNDYRLRIDALERAIAEDRAAGRVPAAVVATAGTVNTGAIDDLPRIADICAREKIWMHVDGAFGALLSLSPAMRPLLSGIERADSIAFDLHKWLYVPIEAGCVLVRDAEAHRAPFSPPAAYLASFDRGISTGAHYFAGLGPQLTRSFRALKVWMALQSQGTSKFGRLIDQNVKQARLLVSLVERMPQLEMTAPAPTNVVCFRYVSDALSADELNALNRELLMRLQESGVAVPSSTVLRGTFALRAAFTNHRTRNRDVVLLAEKVAAMGAEIERAGATATAGSAAGLRNPRAR